MPAASPPRRVSPATDALRERAHELIPGGCHTYAKGDDQLSANAPPFIVRGQGCHVWDADGNRFIEYGMGCRAVALGHAFPAVLDAVRKHLPTGTNFTRPHPIEVECAEELLGLIDGAEMVKFCKDGSTATTGALKLARAQTGREKVAVCGDHPFFAIHDWFIGTTPFDAGIPQCVKDLSLTFRYNDPESLRGLFEAHPGEIAAVILEPAKYDEPADGFLHKVQALCREHGAVFVLDEMITGFRYHLGGAQALYGVTPDLSTFGKALANGHSVSALVGKRSLMELGGLRHDRERVFLLSTTHGAETHALAAAIETMRVYQREPVIETMAERGAQLRDGIEAVARERGLFEAIPLFGPPCNLVFGARDRDGNASQEFRSLLIQELIRRGVLGPSLVISYSHSERDVEETVAAFDGAMEVYLRALEDGVGEYLVGPPSKSVYRKFN
ncbi:3-aminobutyryl-CoA aminotransferase [Planctomycetes bacterium LzC2]|uniref:3-aminobutyryl-CoA aminotransferase n=1 Tax=Alienimonas chondri TaxID=2681879 RepID=A0ABX1VA63_9PLAN|nr:glutamate-1-semialdehyde 2,1-aminomutase [Alienimonas chondri]NNJ24984.1 3-aminobutyryl-CoA aminotransferase [Alienimonas chondri]